jgi:hypothetical protein
MGAVDIGDGCMGEEFWYDVRWQIAAAGNVRNVQYNVIVAMTNPLLGQGPLVMPFQLPIGIMREEIVRNAVHQAMGQLRALHRAQLHGPKQPSPSPS